MNSGFTMASLGDGYRALVIGASGAIGRAFCEQLSQDSRCAAVRELGRNTVPALDLEQPETIASAAVELAAEAPYQLIVHAAGLLHRDRIKPEKSYSAIEADALQAVFQVNTLGPALVLRHFCRCSTLKEQWRCSRQRSEASATTVWVAGTRIALQRQH